MKSAQCLKTGCYWDEESFRPVGPVACTLPAFMSQLLRTLAPVCGFLLLTLCRQSVNPNTAQHVNTADVVDVVRTLAGKDEQIIENTLNPQSFICDHLHK